SSFVSADFHLRRGEISAPLRAKDGYHLIQLIERSGDEARVQHIFRAVPVTEISINQAKAKMDTVRSRIIAGSLGFNEAASKYSDDESAKFIGAFILNRDGSPYIAIDQLDKEMVATI